MGEDRDRVRLDEDELVREETQSGDEVEAHKLEQSDREVVEIAGDDVEGHKLIVETIVSKE